MMGTCALSLTCPSTGATLVRMDTYMLSGKLVCHWNLDLNVLLLVLPLQGMGLWLLGAQGHSGKYLRTLRLHAHVQMHRESCKLGFQTLGQVLQIRTEASLFILRTVGCLLLPWIAFIGGTLRHLCGPTLP